MVIRRFGHQTVLNRILLDVFDLLFELSFIPDDVIEALIYPEWTFSAEELIDLPRRSSFNQMKDPTEGSFGKSLKTKWT